MTPHLAAIAAAVMLLAPLGATQNASGTLWQAASASPPKAAAPGTGSWTTYHHDNAHTGYDAGQPLLAGVSATAGWSLNTLDGEVYAEPLIYNGLVYAATLNNSVYALNQLTGAVQWSVHLRAPQASGWTCGNVAPQGILGTPVIDPGTGRIYVATLSGADQLYRLEGLNLASGLVEMSTVITTPTSTFDWRIEQERGALAVANGYVYVPFGGRAGDCGTYHGWMYAVPTNGAAVTHYYQTPGSGAGFWAAGGVVVDDTTGNVFVTSGNGTSTGCNANTNGTPAYENDAVVRLSPILAHLDAFVPQDWQSNWCGNDQDLGSASPLLISPSLLFQSGKWGAGFLLNPTNLGGLDGQLFPTPKPATYSEANVCFGNHSDATFASFAYAAPFIYMQCNGHGLVALDVNTSTNTFTPCDTCVSPDWAAGGSLTFGPPIVAGGAVWAVDINGSGLYAFDMSTGAPIFHSASFGVDHFVTPSEAGGQVFVPSHNVIRSFSINQGVVFTPAQVDFNGQAAGTTSVASTLTLHNSLGVTLNVTSVALSGANPGSYSKGTDTCSGAAVLAGGTCTVMVTFHPSATGAYPASLTFTDDGVTSPQTVLVDGLGALDNQAHLYTLDSYGGLHADGSSPAMAATAYWPGWNIARSAALFPDGLGGYTMDGFGGLHNFGNAPAQSSSAYWPGWNIARQVVLAPWSNSTTVAGWTLDGFGGIHPFGGALAVTGFSYWGFDIARGLVILPDSTPSSVAGYTLDGYGGLHPFGGATPISNTGYWPGWDIVHSVTLSPNASRANPAGWTLDGWGGIHAFGSAPIISQSAYWPGWDIARGVVAWSGSGAGGWVIDHWGGLHPFGAAPTVSPFPYWPGANVGAGLAGPDFSSGSNGT